VIDRLDEALAQPWNNFNLTRDAPENIPNTKAVRLRLRLDQLRVPLPDAANCVSLRYQVAQKLHACTEVFYEGRENDRFRDVMDVLLVEDLLYDVGLAHVREACIDIFMVRDKHVWPPTVTVYDSWRVPFAELARENGFTPEDVDEAAAALTALIAAIDGATGAS
jgi:hypothetical protein